MFLNKKQAKSYVFRLKKLCYTNNQGNQNIKIDQFSTKNANNQQNQPNSLPKNPLNVPPAVRLDAAFLLAVRTSLNHSRIYPQSLSVSENMSLRRNSCGVHFGLGL